MITAVDSSVLIDVLKPEPGSGERSRRSLGRCLRDGGLTVCEVVFAEVTARFTSPELVRQRLLEIGIGYSPLEEAAASRAGVAWGAYLRSGGNRSRLIADFLVGSHASLQADRLLTRDRGFYRRYFEGLEIIDPSHL